MIFLNNVNLNHQTSDTKISSNIYREDTSWPRGRCQSSFSPENSSGEEAGVSFGVGGNSVFLCEGGDTGAAEIALVDEEGSRRLVASV